MFDNELIEQARNADILQYLQSRGYRLIKSSPHEYRLEEHDSLVISNNRWHWFSKDEGGNTLDFIIKYEGKSFREAIEILTGREPGAFAAKPRDIFISSDYSERKNSTAVELVLPPKAKDFHRVFAYLNRTRKIDSTIIADMMHQGKLYQSNRNNCVFVGTDKEGNIRFACERGTFSGVSYRRDCPGSNKAFCFHMQGRSNTLYTFEAPIDALSHASLFKIRKLDYKQDHRISLGCLGDAALMQYLKDRPEITNVVLSLDNDQWGLAASAKFMKLLMEKGYQVREEFSKNKDYNKDLIALTKPKTLEMTL